MRWTGWASRAAALLLVLATAACGGGDDADGAVSDGSVESESAELTPEEVATDPTALSPEQWTDDAGRLCEEWFSDSLAVEGTDADAAAEVAELAGAFADGLGEIAQPIEITEEAAAFVEAVADLADEYDALAADQEAGVADADAISGLQESFNELRALADGLSASGLECELDPTAADADDADEPGDEEATGIDGPGVDPRDGIADLTSDADLAPLAWACHSGAFVACDQLADESPASDAGDSFRHYAATCGGRLDEPQPGECEALAG